jgi:hypothetical protein
LVVVAFFLVAFFAVAMFLITSFPAVRGGLGRLGQLRPRVLPQLSDL